MLPNIAWIQWTPEDIDAAAADALSRKRAGLDAVLAVPDAERTFANTIAAQEYAGDSACDVQQCLELMMNVHPDAAIRSAAQAAVDRMETAVIEMEYDQRLWTAVQQWAARGEHLADEDQKLADDMMRDMRRMGFALTDDRFAQLKRITAELKKLESEFEKTINDWDDAILVTRDQLDGMPERYIEGLTRDGERYRVSLQYPDIVPFMQHATNDAARRELAGKDLRKGGPENLERLARIISLRQEGARLLGYATHADFACETRLAKTKSAVETFLTDIIAKLIPAARRELVDLIDIKKRVLGLEKRAPIHFHEISYWGHQLLKERYDVDSEKVKEYFPLDRVLNGMFSVYQEVLGVKFVPVPDAKLWHSSVALYEMRDGERVIGHFALDLHPRVGKYGHAATFTPLLGRQESDGTKRIGLAALVCNFPTPSEAHPSLLSHGEVETLFHEFGHICHALLFSGRWQRQNGLYAPLDFVEMPSQLLEEWAWDPTVLARISGHYRSGEPLSQELLEKIIAARRHMEANYYLQQAVRALYDVRMHGQPTDAPVEPLHLAQLHRDMKLQYEAIDLPDDSIMAAGWSHMGSYDAGYYSYLWSKVYALDMYTRFAGNPLDATTGSEYRAVVLETGISKPPLEIIKRFIGREPSNAAFLKALGIDTLPSCT